MPLLKSVLNSDYTVTDSYADIDGLFIKIPKDGYYVIVGNITHDCIDDDGATAKCALKLAVNGTNIPDSGGRNQYNDGSNARSHQSNTSIAKIMYLKKSDEITIKALMVAGDNTTIKSTSSESASYIEALGPIRID